MPKRGSGRARSHRFPHLQLQRRRLADGTVREHWYHRLTRKKVVGTPGTLEFADSYAEAAKATAIDRDPVNLTHLIRQYKESPEFADLANRTRRDYDKYSSRSTLPSATRQSRL